MKYELLIKKARDFAIEKHGNQMYGDKPYVFHLDEVFNLSLHYNLPPIYQVAAYLHDLLEDQNIAKEEIVNNFGYEVYDLIFSVSGFGETRKDRALDIKNKLEINHNSINLKMIDRIANVKNSILNNQKLLKMYKKEHPEYLEIFSKGDEQIFNDLNDLLNFENKKVSISKIKSF